MISIVIIILNIIIIFFFVRIEIKLMEIKDDIMLETLEILDALNETNRGINLLLKDKK